jgi:hypothetical protein
MATWTELRAARPDLAEAGRALLYQYGVGLAFLATVRADGGPRLHPICPLLTEGSLFAFLIPSPKRTDLIRDGRYALHSFPCEDSEDAFYLTGRARLADDAAARSALVDQFHHERRHTALSPVGLGDQWLFEFDIDTCLCTKTTGHADTAPRHTVWDA